MVAQTVHNVTLACGLLVVLMQLGLLTL